MAEGITRYLITPLEWAAEAQSRAAQALGTVEGRTALVEARRYREMHLLITKLETQLAQATALASIPREEVSGGIGQH